MAKKESTFSNMVLTLLLITACAALTLAMVYNVTKEPIERGRLERRQAAISFVVPEFDEIISKKFMPSDVSDSLEFNFAYKDGELVGIAVQTFTNQGFSGYISAMVGFYPDKRIYDVVHLQHSETPGLGDKIEKDKSDWSDQFRDFDPAEKDLRLKSAQGDVDGITAATITAEAYCDAIDRAYKTLKENLDEKHFSLNKMINN